MLRLSLLGGLFLACLLRPALSQQAAAGGSATNGMSSMQQGASNATLVYVNATLPAGFNSISTCVPFNILVTTTQGIQQVNLGGLLQSQTMNNTNTTDFVGSDTVGSDTIGNGAARNGTNSTQAYVLFLGEAAVVNATRVAMVGHTLSVSQQSGFATDEPISMVVVTDAPIRFVNSAGAGDVVIYGVNTPLLGVTASGTGQVRTMGLNVSDLEMEANGAATHYVSGNISRAQVAMAGMSRLSLNSENLSQVVVALYDVSELDVAGSANTNITGNASTLARVNYNGGSCSVLTKSNAGNTFNQQEVGPAGGSTTSATPAGPVGTTTTTANGGVNADNNVNTNSNTNTNDNTNNNNDASINSLLPPLLPPLLLPTVNVGRRMFQVYLGEELAQILKMSNPEASPTACVNRANGTNTGMPGMAYNGTQSMQDFVWTCGLIATGESSCAGPIAHHATRYQPSMALRNTTMNVTTPWQNSTSSNVSVQIVTLAVGNQTVQVVPVAALSTQINGVNNFTNVQNTVSTAANVVGLEAAEYSRNGIPVAGFTITPGYLSDNPVAQADVINAAIQSALNGTSNGTANGTGTGMGNGMGNGPMTNGQAANGPASIGPAANGPATYGPAAYGPQGGVGSEEDAAGGAAMGRRGMGGRGGMGNADRNSGGAMAGGSTAAGMGSTANVISAYTVCAAQQPVYMMRQAAQQDGMMMMMG